MDRMKTTRWLLAAALLMGCGDDGPRNLGDNDAGQADVPALDTGAPSDTGSPTDTGPADAGSPTDTGPADAGSPTDTGPADAGSPTDTGPADAGSSTDTGPADAGSPTDTGPADAGSPTDAGPMDAGPRDAGSSDSGAVDAGPRDAGPMDAGPRDAGPMDAGAPTDAGPADTGVMCTPATETCNGRDDDCDGLVDESGCGTHLLITEVVVTPTAGEFVEVHNPTSAAVSLTNVYLADTSEYACRLAGVTCAPTVSGAISTTDFVARFPAGTALMPGQYVTVAIADPAVFRATYGRCPDYYLRVTSDAGTTDPMCPMSQIMLSAGATGTNTIGTGTSLTDGGEPVVLFSWDQTAPRVVDLDYVVYGNPSTSNPRVDKSGLMSTVSGMTATYLADTPSAMQATLTAHTSGRSNVRCDFSEGSERRTGGNGAMGHDETSENWAVTWRSSPTPGDAGPASVTPGAENNCR
jgi:hypothetical protein